MSLHKKTIKGSGLVQLRDSVSSSDGTSVTTTETWIGDYSDLRTKQNSLILQVKGTSLTPTEADQGELTITREVTIPAYEGNPSPESVVTIEVLWVELRKPVLEHPAFQFEISVIKSIQAEAEAEDGGTPPAEPNELKLYELLAKGVNEYAVGVPVVRRTTTNVRGNIGSGNAWIRDTPPVSVTGEWEWLKTADERRQVGRRFDQVEEWTAANTWDEILYP
jgi:hypothetical protein